MALNGILDLLEELDTSGNFLTRYTQGPSIDEPLSEVLGSTTSFYQLDFLGKHYIVKQLRR